MRTRGDAACAALGKWIAAVTGVTLRRFLEALRPIPTHTIDIAGHQITAEDPINQAAPDVLHAIQAHARQGHSSEP